MIIALSSLIFIVSMLAFWAFFIRKGNQRSEVVANSLRSMELEEQQAKSVEQQWDLAMERAVESRRNPRLPSYSMYSMDGERVSESDSLQEFAQTYPERFPSLFDGFEDLEDTKPLPVINA